MARTRTFDDMVADVRLRANMENSEFVTDDEILEYLNQELAELHACMVANEGQPHFRSKATINVLAPAFGADNLYPLPADFWQLQEIVALIGGLSRPLQPFMPVERARLLNAQLYTYRASPQYRIEGPNIEFLPATQAYTATLYYVAASPRGTLGSVPPATVDGFNGYEIAAIYGATATCLAKEESDASFYSGQKERILSHIKAMAGKRDALNPERVADVVGLFEGSFPLADFE